MEYHDGAPLSHVADVVAMGAHRYGEKTALILQEGDDRMSFAQLDRRASQVANVLADRGAGPDDRVGLFLPNTLQFPETFFGAIRAGAVPVPLNLRMDPETLSFIVEDATIDHLVTSPLLLGGMETERATVVAPEELAGETGISHLYVPGMDQEGMIDYEAVTGAAPTSFDRPDRAMDDIAIQPYTSGTTGRPKGVLLSHENVLAELRDLTTSGTAADPDDTVLMVLPLFHVPTLITLMGSYLYQGGTTVLQAIPNPSGMLQAVEDYQVNQLPAVPALHTMMYEEYRQDPDEYDLSSLEVLGSAAAPLPEDTKQKLTSDYGVVLNEGWGMTETAGVATMRPPTTYKEAGCIGMPIRNLSVKLVDPETRETVVSAATLDPLTGPPDIDTSDEEVVTGEIAVRGPSIFEGYYNRPETTDAVFDEEGWFYTDDIVRVDEDGDLWIVDRADDMIIAGGENIYPAEVEDALYTHSDVAEAAVVAAPHEVKGEAPVAFVVPTEGADIDEESLRRFTLERVPTYAHPRRIFFVDELPRSATQKVQRYKLEDDVEERVGGALESSERL